MAEPQDSQTQGNVDPEEIQKFDQIASRWWDLQGEFKPLHDMNPVRCNYIDARSPLADKQVVDVGCGGGILSEAMAQRGAFVTGLDMGEGPLEVAKLHALESGLNIDYQQSTVEAYAEQQPEQFDVVTCLEMLEHVPDPSSVVNACAKLAKPGANLYFSTINRNPKSYLISIVGAEYIAKLLPKGTHEYKKLIKPSELSRWLREAGLVVEDISGMSYNLLSKRFSISSTDVDVNYIVCARKPQ